MDNLLFYSVNAYLAYYIGEQFYRQTHFAWCSPVFNPEKLDAYDPRYKIPPSSSPASIYKTMCNDVKKQDRHSLKIKSVIAGLKTGATHKQTAGVINDQDFGQIINIIDNADIRDFRPLIYAIPRENVQGKILKVEVEERANPLGIEYQIPNLKTDEFDLIELEDF